MDWLAVRDTKTNWPQKFERTNYIKLDNFLRVQVAGGAWEERGGGALQGGQGENWPDDLRLPPPQVCDQQNIVQRMGCENF